MFIFVMQFLISFFYEFFSLMSMLSLMNILFSFFYQYNRTMIRLCLLITLLIHTEPRQSQHVISYPLSFFIGNLILWIYISFLLKNRLILIDRCLWMTFLIYVYVYNRIIQKLFYYYCYPVNYSYSSPFLTNLNTRNLMSLFILLLR